MSEPRFWAMWLSAMAVGSVVNLAIELGPRRSCVVFVRDGLMYIVLLLVMRGAGCYQ
jgi:hypothetical protein